MNTTVHHRSARAMGTSVEVTMVGSTAAVADALLHRVDDLETRWSRFRPTSELSRLNASTGAPCIVSADTFTLVDHLVDAWYRTAGVFDPTVHDAIVELGYDRSWPAMPAQRGDALEPAHPTPGCAGIHLAASSRLVWLPRGVHLDPGGLGKGLAADLVADEAMAAGAAGVMVNLGGDLRVIGDSPTGTHWEIDIEHPDHLGQPIARVATRNGGIATSSTRKRRWMNGDRAVHHVLDPRTAHPAFSGWASATALATTAVDAEVGATVLLVDGNGPDGAADLPWLTGGLLAATDGRTAIVGDHPELFLALTTT